MFKDYRSPSIEYEHFKKVVMNSQFVILRTGARFFFVALLVGVLVGSNLAWAQSPGAPSLFSDAPKVYGTVGDSLGGPYVVSGGVDPKWVRVTFYRPKSSVASGSARLEVNGVYHSTLQAGAYTDLCVAPGVFEFGVRMVQTGVSFESFPVAVLALRAAPAQHLFLQVNDRLGGRASLVSVDAQKADDELKNTKRQIHAVSRVSKGSECVSAASSSGAGVAAPTPVAGNLAPPAAAVKEVVVLGVGTLFAFAESDFSAITPKGQEALDQFVGRLKAAYGQDESLHIQITGHADPLGNALENQRLSVARAQAVRTYMVQKGIRAERISAKGVGSREPLITGCRTNITPESIECNKPNRRVVVSIQTMAR
jgi:outer membrane protein OmpA-like peptidoglycan-associated protein